MVNTALSKLSVLVVEDSDYYRRLIVATLKAMGIGYSVEAESGDEAFKIQQRKPVDIALVDWVMTPMNGLEFTRKIRNDPSSAERELPIIMITAHTEEERIYAARDAGVTEILTKPISGEGLFSRIHSVIMNPRPFVNADSFVGPDRRRVARAGFGGPERRQKDTADAE